MPDHKKRPGGQDRTRINVKEDSELRDWSKKFGVMQEAANEQVLYVQRAAGTTLWVR
jgi:hypothetical protein